MSSKTVAEPKVPFANQVPRFPERPSLTTSSAAQASEPRMLKSSALMGKHGLVLIQHQGEIYRLQTTRQGKLILTK
jgi:hemin uptake protein HemP